MDPSKCHIDLYSFNYLMYDYLVKFFWDRVLSVVFNSCGQIALTMDDMHLSSKSGQGVWQLIQGIQETS